MNICPYMYIYNYSETKKQIFVKNHYHEGLREETRLSLLSVFDVFSTVHHNIELFYQPTLMQNFLYSLTICLLHYYPRHVPSINMPIFRRKNCIHTTSGIFALELSERSYINIRSTVLLRQY